MNNYERLVQITHQKLNLSKEFLDITQNIQSLVLKEEIDDISAYLDKREYIINQVNDLDQDFLKLFENLKKDSNFEENIKSYPKLSQYIQSIELNFKESNKIDELIRPNIISELENVKEEMKKIKDNQNNKIASNKYSQDQFKKLTGSNFGIFIDEKN